MISREMSNKNTLNGLFKSNFELLLEKLPSDYTSSVSSYRNPNMANNATVLELEPLYKKINDMKFPGRKKLMDDIIHEKMIKDPNILNKFGTFIQKLALLVAAGKKLQKNGTVSVSAGRRKRTVHRKRKTLRKRKTHTLRSRK